MSSSQDQGSSERKASVSLILPMVPGQTISAQQVNDFRQALTHHSSTHDRMVEVVIAGQTDSSNGWQNGKANDSPQRIAVDRNRDPRRRGRGGLVHAGTRRRAMHQAART